MNRYRNGTEMQATDTSVNMLSKHARGSRADQKELVDRAIGILRTFLEEIEADYEGMKQQNGGIQELLLGRPLAALIGDERRRAFHSKITQLHQSLIVSIEEWEREAPCSFDAFNEAVTITGVRDWERRLFALHWLLPDLAERKRVERVLHISEECFSSILNACPQPMSISALEDGHYIAVNESFLRMGDFTREEVIGRTPNDLGFWADPDLEIKIKQLLKDECKIRNLEIKGCTKYGGQRVFAFSADVVKLGNQEFIFGTAVDITENKRAALYESEDLYRDLVEHSRDLICTHDLQGQIISVNEAAARISGYDSSFFLNKNICDLLIPEFRHEFDNYLARIQKDGFAEGLLQVRTSTGEKRIWQYYNTLRTEGVEAPIVRGMAHDITEIKRVEEELSRNNSILKSVIEGTTDAIFVKDIQGRYLMINQAYARFLGKPEEEVIGKDDTELLTPENSRLVMETDHKVRTSGETEKYDFTTTVAGSTRTYLVTKDPYRNNSGKIIGVIGISRDITERKLVEERLQEQAALLNHARDAIMVRDLEHRIIFWNSGAERMYGLMATEVIGTDIRGLLYRKTDLSQVDNAHAILIKEGEWTGELRQLTKGGKEIIVDSRRALVCDDSGHPKSILIINTDITEKKELEAKFLREQRVDTVGHLAAGIAHDINNVLSPVLMAIESLRLKLTDDETQTLLALLKVSTERGAALVSQMLSFAKGGDGIRRLLQPEYLIRDFAKVLKEIFPKSIRIKVTLQDKLWIVAVDAIQMYQVIMNLCVNARDAMPAGGELSITAENTYLSYKPAVMNPDAKAGPFVRITISDTGMGISPDIIERIFDPFFTTKELRKGTGLGLSTALRIMKAHGGFININSKVGRGTEFNIYLPAIESEAISPMENEATDMPAGDGEMVLIADNELAMRVTAQSTLEVFGYRVMTSGDGVEAVRLYAQNKDEIGIVLLDMDMPNMDGLETASELLRIDPQVKIIAVSGSDAEAGLAELAKNGKLKAFIRKPYTVERLLRTLAEIRVMN